MNDIREIITLIEQANAQAIAAHIRDIIGVDTLNQLDAWNLTAPASGLKFRVRKGGDINFVEVTYKEDDLYDIELGAMEGVMDALRDRHEVIDRVENVSAEGLRKVFQDWTRQ